MSDGSLHFDTKIDESGFKEGIKGINDSFKNCVEGLKNVSKTGTDAMKSMSASQMSLSNSISQTTEKISKLKAKISEIENQKIATDQFNELQQSIDKIQQEYDELTKRKKEWQELGIDENNSIAMRNLSAEIEQVSNRLAEATQKKKEMQESGTAYNTQGVTVESAKLSEQLEKEQQRLSVLNKRMEEHAQKSNKASKDVKKFSQAQKDSGNSGALFAKQLTKITTMLKARVFRQVVSTIFNGIKAGFQNLAQYSSEFNKSLSGLQGSFTQLNNALATAFAPVLEAITPILQAVIDKVIEVINVISQLTARLFGNATTFKKASKVTTDYAKSLGSANKESKKLASFDTIEKLEDSSKNSGTTDVKDMFEEVAIDENIINIVDKLKEKFAEFGDTLSDVFGNIDFESIWNNMLDAMKRIGDWINTNLIPIFVNLGLTYKKYVGDLFNTFLTTILPLIQSFMQNASQLLQPIANLFATVFGKLPAIIRPILDLVSSIWAGLWDGISNAWNKHGQPIFDGIKTAVEWLTVIFNDLWNNVLEPIWSNFMSILQQLWDDHLKPLWDNLMDFFGQVSELVLTLWNNILAPIVDWLVVNLGPVVTNIINTIFNVVSSVVGGIIDLVSGIIKSLTGIIEFLTGVFSGDWDKAWEGIKKTIDGIVDGVLGLFKGLINGIVDILNFLIECILDQVNVIIGIVNKLILAINDALGDYGKIPYIAKINTSVVKIPHLASGTVVPASQGEFLAMLGDNNKETEVVSPLSTMKEAFMEALSESGGSGGSQTVILELNGQELGRAVYKLNKKESQRIGTSLKLSNGGAY